MNIIDKKQYNFSPSVNIIRDNGEDLNYIITPNAKLVYSQLEDGYKVGVRAYNLVGAYGSGKSAFLKALESNITGQIKGFQTEIFDNFQSIKFVGEYTSLKNIFIDFLKIEENSNSKNIILELDNYYKKSNSGLLILIDEFGKFLEYAAKNNPEEELYFIQELAEYVNDRRKNILFITTLHQDFNQYAFALPKVQKNEWDKVKGRLKEITFNEPVEQLLFLAAKRIEKLGINKTDTELKNLFKTIKDSKLFPLRDYLDEKVAQSLYPLDILSASILTLALQKYGQNERSLFSFLESNEPYNLFDYNTEKNPYFNVACVFDYLQHNYYSFLTSKYNPDFSQWTNIKTAIERIEGHSEQNVDSAIKIIKTVGLLNLFGSSSGLINTDFILNYARFSLGIQDAEKIVDELVHLKILKFVNYLNKYTLHQGTDLDIDTALENASKQVEVPNNIIDYLNEYLNNKYIAAKSIYYTKGTPRFFEFNLVEQPSNLIPTGEIDGYIQLIISESISVKEIIEFSRGSEEPILFVYYHNYKQIQDIIYENIKIKKIKIDYSEDKIALNELNNFEQSNAALISKLINEDLFSNNQNVEWFYKGEKLTITSTKDINKKLSEICDNTYFGTPVFRNEMVNKTKISSPISTARKNLIKNLIENNNKEDLGFDASHFPPEKTIYLSLLKDTGIHRLENDSYIIAQPNDESFHHLWELGEAFLESSKYSKRNLQDFVDQLSKKPFKLKQGFIDFWLPVFLFIKRNDFALFYKDTYVLELSLENLELVSKNANEYEVKAFDVDGVKLIMFNQYRQLLQQAEKDAVTNNSFIETIKPFLKFYKEIPEYSQKTNRLSKRALLLREAITKSKYPETTFFEDFPSALGTSIVELQKNKEKLESYISDLQDTIREIRVSYAELVDRFEDFILNNIIGEKLDFESYKSRLQKRFKNLKTHLLKPNQKVFIQRLKSPLDDKNSWLNSLVQVCISKSLNVISDEEEDKLYTIFSDIIAELDNLNEISKRDFDEEKEEVFKIEITSFKDGLKKNLVRLPKDKINEISEKEKELKKLLGKDNRTNILILAKLLQEELKK